MHHTIPHSRYLQRRAFLGQAGVGLGSAALASLLGRERRSVRGSRACGRAGTSRIIAPRAKRVIFLCMAGGPSHLETFDYKPKLAELDGQPMPESFTKGQPIAQLQGQTAQVSRGR